MNCTSLEAVTAGRGVEWEVGLAVDTRHTRCSSRRTCYRSLSIPSSESCDMRNMHLRTRPPKVAAHVSNSHGRAQPTPSKQEGWDSVGHTQLRPPRAFLGFSQLLFSVTKSQFVGFSPDPFISSHSTTIKFELHVSHMRSDKTNRVPEWSGGCTTECIFYRYPFTVAKVKRFLNAGFS